jgi:ferredoxin
MSYIIGSKCIDLCDAACLRVCPVDCIHGPINTKGMGGELVNMSEEDKIGKQLYINPIDCIKCGACIPECPVDAIYRTEEEAIALGDEISVIRNYEFFGLKFDGKK